MHLTSKLLWGGWGILVARLSNQNSAGLEDAWEGIVHHRWTSPHHHHHPPAPAIFKANQVSSKSPLLKCKLIGFELGVKNQSSYDVPIKTILQFTRKTHFSFQVEKVVFSKQTIIFWLSEHCKRLFCVSSSRKKSDLISSLVVHSVVKSISVYLVHRNSSIGPTWEHGTEEWH